MIDQQAVPASSLHVTLGKPRRRWLSLLALVVAAHASINTLFNPIGTSDSGTFAAVLALTAIGAIVSQPVQWAMFAVFAPTRWAIRLLVSFTGVVLLACCLIWGVELKLSPAMNTSHTEALLLVLEYGIFAAVLAAWRWLRGWRLVPGRAESGLAGRQFSLMGLLAAMTVLSLVFAVCYWTLPLSHWPDTWDAWKAVGIETTLAALVTSGMTLPMIPAAGFVLGKPFRPCSWWSPSSA